MAKTLAIIALAVVLVHIVSVQLDGALINCSTTEKNCKRCCDLIRGPQWNAKIGKFLFTCKCINSKTGEKLRLEQVDDFSNFYV